jgi:hypothetical protein
MQLLEFNNLLTELSNYYERKEPKTSTIDLWYNKIHAIPSEPIKWIAKKIEESNDSFPKNLPSAIWGAYTEWQQANPEKLARESFFDCPDCNEGLIFAKKQKNGVNYSYVFRCARCKQNHYRAYPLDSPIELLEEYEVTLKKGNLKSSYKVERNIKNIISSIGKETYEPTLS